ncbi:MAG TPA: S-adenosylmethionine:tRNA ribosyltransferase-isomerase [Streptosporangiaceae bacterium]|nr:S-adenosylmethionine:tRNA ribosyltransferase-isomerase [Streptosporangiaceae bacterium]
MRRSASAPPEERGLTRDGVCLLVATPDGLAHARFADLPHYLHEGDLLVVNTSATVAAALDGQRPDGRAVTVHLSTTLDDGRWLVELREGSAGRGRVGDASRGDTIALPGGESLTLLTRYPDPAANRLWTAAPTVLGDVAAFLAGHGRPIRYDYVPDPWPLAAYQTVFARDPGSAEMPSAARPFTTALVTALVTAGVVIAPVTLHAGVASLDASEPPLQERFSVPGPTAELVNLTRAAGRRVVAVGTTCTRALESATGPDGTVHASRGWTSLVLGPDNPVRTVTGIITGWHDPAASHLALLQAVAGTRLVQAAYTEAERAGYLWHEFGDSCLLLPPQPWPSAGAGQDTGTDRAESPV